MDDEFTTPEAIADQMVAYLFDDEPPDPTSRVLVPGCGTGNLIGAIERYCEQRQVDVPEGVAIEIDQQRLNRAQERYGDIGFDFHCRDFLTDPSDLGTVEYVISNPPVVPWDDIPADRREGYEYRFTTLAEGYRGRVGLHVLFLEQSLTVLAEDGRLVFVLPDDFATPDTTPSPLAELLREYGVERIESVQTTIEDAPVSPAITVLSQRGTMPEYKRRALDWKTTINELLRTHEIIARDVMTTDPVTYTPSDDVTRVFFNLVREDFDVIPVVEDDECVGYVSRRTIDRTDSGTLEEHFTETVDPHFVAPDASFDTLLRQLSTHRFALIGIDRSLEGVVTRFDLNRLPVYFHLYSKLARLEVGLRNACRSYDLDLEAHLDYSNIHSIRRTYRWYRGVVPDEFACMTLGQLVMVVESAGLRDELGAEATAPSEVDLRSLNTLRTHIAHYYPLVHTMDDFTDDDAQRTAYRLAVENQLLDEYIRRLAQ